MSATEVPILDPENMMFDLSKGRDEVTTSVFYDPVAKLNGMVGLLGPSIYLDEKLGFDGGAKQALIQFTPKLTREMLETGDIWTLFREKKIVSVPLASLTILYKYIDDMLMGFIKAETFYGIGFTPVLTDFSRQNEGYPGFEFWPDGVPGRDKALAIYMLYGLIPMIERYEANYIDRKEAGSRVKRIAIAIDNGLIELTGTEAFPFNERVDENFTMILKGDEINV